MKLKKGDTIVVTLGKDKGREGRIERVDIKSGKVIVPGVNMYKKHVKPKEGKAGEIIVLSRPLDVAKVALVCPKCKKPTRVGYELKAKKKIRICRKCKKEI